MLASDAGSDLERAFETAWNMIGGPRFEHRNYRFLEDRKLEVDFAIPWPVAVGVEINGGVWMKKGGHSYGKGLLRDYEKLLLAQTSGWALYFIPGDWFLVGNRIDLDKAEKYLGPIRDAILGRLEDVGRA